jgi:DNA-binding XRE family transcriptional regulator
MRERSEDVSRDALIAKLQKELIILRIKADLTQEELASVIGLSRQRRIARLKKETPKWHGAYIWHSFRSIPSTSELLTLLGIEVEGILYDLNDSVRKKLSSGNLMNFLL